MTVKELSQLSYLRKEIHRLTTKISEMKQKGKVTYELEVLLKKRLNECREELFRLEQYIETVDDSRIRQIMTLRYEQGMSWVQVAQRMVGGASESCARMAVTRFLNKEK